MLEIKLSVLPTGPQAMGLRGASRLDLWATRQSIGRRGMGTPRGAMFKHGIEDHEELAHGGGERELGRLTGATQTPVKGLEGRVEAHRGEGRHVERRAHRRAPRPTPCAGRAGGRCHD